MKGNIMAAPVALQLYSVREELEKGFDAGVRKVAVMGYAGVETAGFPGTTPEAAAKLFRDLGLTACSAHVGLPIGDTKAETLDTMNALGSTRIVSGFGPKDYETVDAIKETCDKLNEAGEVAAENGMTFSIHNHWWEFLRVGDRYAYQIALDHLAPAILFEVDTYWVQTAGVDPATAVRELGSRAPLLHIKDGPCKRDVPMTAVGDGEVDFHGIVKASAGVVEWMIVELDSCATDMMEAVAKSCAYLTSEGLAEGKR